MLFSIHLQLVDSPRDAVTISRTFNDATTLIDISTSLPRSPDEPTYLRPSPPYVRSDVTCESTAWFTLSPRSFFSASVCLVYTAHTTTAERAEWVPKPSSFETAHHLLLAT